MTAPAAMRADPALDNQRINKIKRFREWGSITPGHPERGVTPGVEVTTGPLSQGFGNGVGFAMPKAHLAARYNPAPLRVPSVRQRTVRPVDQCNAARSRINCGAMCEHPHERDCVAQEQTMTEERKREQKPWYPTIERMPEIRDVETWQNRSSGDDRVLLEDAEVEENAPADDPDVGEAAASSASIAPINPAND